MRPSNGCADDLRTKIRAERLSNGYPSQGPTEPPLHRNSALLVEADWSVAFSCRGTTPDFGPRSLCVLESCLLLSRTATHGQSPSAGVDVPSLTYSLCWRTHLSREALAPEALSAQLAVLTCSLSWRSHLHREALRPRLCLPDARHKPTRPLGAVTCFARPCARCFVCPLTNSTSWRSHLLREALRPMLCLPNSRFNPRPAAVPDTPRPAAVPDNSPAHGVVPNTPRPAAVQNV